MDDDWISVGENVANSNATFPQKLFIMSLRDFDKGDVLLWLPHGLAFKIVDSDRFSEEIIPRYFKHTKLTSFQRQLNLYGFRRITKGEDHGAYFHPNFQRGRRDLIASIRRLPGKGNVPPVDASSNALNCLLGARAGGINPADSKRVGYDRAFAYPQGAMPAKSNMADIGEPPAKKVATGNYSYGYNPNAMYDTFARNNVTTVPASGDGNVMYHQNIGGQGQAACMPYGMAGGNNTAGRGQQVKSMSKLTMNIGFGKIMSGAAGSGATSAAAAAAQRGYPYPQQYQMHHNGMNTYGTPVGMTQTQPIPATSSSSYRSNMDSIYQQSAMSLSQSQGHYYPSSSSSSSESKDVSQQHELQLLQQIQQQQQSLGSTDSSGDPLGHTHSSYIIGGGLTTENVLQHSHSEPILSHSIISATEAGEKYSAGESGLSIPRTYSQQQLLQSLPPSSNSSNTGNTGSSIFGFGTLSHSSSTASLKKFEEQIPSFDEAMAMLAAR